jgi:hypothetical protein
MEVLNMLSKNDVERERYQARLKWERDQTAFIDEAQMKGEWIGRIHLCERMLKMSTTPKGDLGALRIEELQQKAKALEAQLGVVAE